MERIDADIARRGAAIALGYLFFASAAVAAVPSPGAAAEDVDLPRHELVFAHHADAARKDYDIWRMCGDGTQVASLVTAPGNQVTLTVSPDGDEPELYILEPRDGSLRRMTDNAFYDSGAAWTPDGSAILFTRDFPSEADGGAELRPDGSRRQVLNALANTEMGHVWRPGEHFCR